MNGTLLVVSARYAPGLGLLLPSTPQPVLAQPVMVYLLIVKFAVLYVMVYLLSTAPGLSVALMLDGLPATVSPNVRVYMPLRASPGRRPVSVPVNGGCVR